jgi:hypothetical protein
MEFEIFDTVDVIAYDIRATFEHPDTSSKLIWGTLCTDDDDEYTAIVRTFRELWDKHNAYGYYHELILEVISYFEIGDDNEVRKLTYSLKGDDYMSDEELYKAITKKVEKFRGV